jgi:hypothetical protein
MKRMKRNRGESPKRFHTADHAPLFLKYQNTHLSTPTRRPTQWDLYLNSRASTHQKAEPSLYATNRRTK